MNTINQRQELMLQLLALFQTEPASRLAETFQGEWRLLFHLAERPEFRTIPSEISNSLTLSRPRVTSILNALRKKGYVEMEINEEDRRKVNVILTRKGQEHVARRRAGLEALLDYYISEMGHENIDTLIAMLRQSRQIMTLQSNPHRKGDNHEHF